MVDIPSHKNQVYPVTAMSSLSVRESSEHHYWLHSPDELPHRDDVALSPIVGLCLDSPLPAYSFLYLGRAMGICKVFEWAVAGSVTFNFPIGNPCSHLEKQIIELHRPFAVVSTIIPGIGCANKRFCSFSMQCI
jgi:hypothetical protein